MKSDNKVIVEMTRVLKDLYTLKRIEYKLHIEDLELSMEVAHIDRDKILYLVDQRAEFLEKLEDLDKTWKDIEIGTGASPWAICNFINHFGPERNFKPSEQIEEES